MTKNKRINEIEETNRFEIANLRVYLSKMKNNDKELQMKDEMIAARDEALSAAKRAWEASCNEQNRFASMGGNLKLVENEHEIASLKEEITNLKQTLSLRLNVSERAITRLETNLKDKHEDIANKDKEIISLKDELATLQAKLMAREDGISRLKVDLKNKSEQEDNISRLRVELKKKTEEIAGKDAQITLLTSTTIHSPPRKRQCTDQSPIESNKVLTIQLGQEHTSCGICLSKYSTDTKNKDNNITKHLPVLSASSKSCDHCFCHGCILKQQASLPRRMVARFQSGYLVWYVGQRLHFALVNRSIIEC